MRKDFHFQKNVTASVVIFSAELQATTIKYHWHLIFPIIVHIQILPISKKKP